MSAKKTKAILFIIVAGIAAILPLVLWAFASNPPLARTGAPTESTCASCHSGGANAGHVAITFSGGTTYTPGVPKQVTVTVTDPNAAVFGYEMTAVQAAATSTGAGTMTAGDANSSVRAGTGANSTKFYASQTNDGASTFVVNWTPPVTSVGNVTFYVSSVGGDGNGDPSSGQSVYGANATITPPVVTLPNLTVAPSTLSFTAQAGGAAPAAQSVATSSSGAAISYTTTSTTATGGAWLTATPSGTTPGSISVSVAPGALAAGTYTGTVSVASAGAFNSPQTVAVTFTVTAAALPTLTVAPATLSFTAVAGGAAPAAQSVATTSSGAAISYTTTSTTASGGAWLTATPASGTTPGSISVSVAPGVLAAGTYTGTVSVASAGAANSPRTVAVTFVVTSAALPTLTVAPATLSFTAVAGGAAPAAQSVATTSSGAAISYTTTSTTASGGAWLTATPASGTTPGSISVSVAPGTLAAGTYTGTVSVASAGAANSPRTVVVTFTVTSAALPTLTVAPATLSFTAVAGGAAPAAQSVATTSSGAAISYTTSSSATWLTASPASGTTPGSISVSVIPGTLTAGTYTGTVSVASAGAANSPRTIAVTFTVTSSALPSLMVSPANLSFTAQTGGAAPAAQSIAVSSSGAALSYSTTATSSATWLTASPSSGATPGTISVSVNPSGLAAGTYNGSVSVASVGAANSPQTVPVTFVVTAAGTVTLKSAPSSLTFYSKREMEDGRLRKNLYVTTSSGGPVAFTAIAHGGTWLTVTPSGGTTPGLISVRVSPQGLVSGTYSATVELAASGATTLVVPVTFVFRGGEGGDLHGGFDNEHRVVSNTSTFDPGHALETTALWINGLGVASLSPNDPTNQGLLLSNNFPASSRARAGVVFENVEGTSLSALGFDIRQGSLCTGNGPRFIVTTSDDVIHTLGGCDPANIQQAPATGWSRYRFDPAQASPAITPDAIVKSISLMLDEGPDANSGIVVLDNININDTFIEKE